MSDFVCGVAGQWIDPAYLIPAVIVLISSGLVPFSLHRFKLKRERAEKLFDTRRQEYQSYFKVIESAAKLAGQNYDEFISKTLPEASARLYQSGCSADAIVSYQSTLNDFTRGVQEGFSKIANELTSLRIVCSSALALKLDNFESAYGRLLSMQPRMLEELRSSITAESFLSGNYNFQTPTQVEVVALGSELALLRSSIILTMRKELGYHD